MSFNQQNNKRQRASSAKSSKEKVRPQSGNSAKNVKKLDFIENIYTGALTSKRQGRTAARIGYGLGDQGQHKKSMSKGYKETEQLYEENLLLKRQINNLKEQLSRQIGKTQAFRKKNSEFTKNLDIHFQKEMYWTNNSNKNMVMGIKNQYEKIKQKYQQKCQEYDEMTQQFIYSQAREDRSYIDLLQKQNKKLQKRVNEVHQEMKILQHGTITSIVQDTIQSHNKYKYQLHQINQNLEETINKGKQVIQNLKSTLTQRQKKITFLQKLLLEKDNNQHAARKKLKKLQKQKQQVVQQYAFYKRAKEQKIASNYQHQKKLKQNYEQQAQRQGLIFKQQIQQKNKQINKLEKEVAYLTTLLSYWKPLDEINQFGGSTHQQNNFIKNDDRDVLLQYSLGSTLIKFNKSQNQTFHIKVEDQDTKSITKSIIDKSRKGSMDYNRLVQQQKNTSEVMTKSINFTKNDQLGKRVQMTAEKRQTQEGVKSRRIHQQQIVDICETLKYRFIGLNVPIEEIRNIFDYKIQENGNILDSQDQQEWKKQYITMKETIQILRNNKIFGLNQTDSLCLARYLIEDSLTEYVYCDPNNQNLRTVVKSIIKTAIGEYQTSRNINSLIQEAQIVVNKYETNLESALKATAPKGFISKKKLVELIKGLGIEINEEIKDYLIGKIVIKSDNLSNLKYSVLFEK